MESVDQSPLVRFDVVTLGSATVDVFIETEKQGSITKKLKGKDTPFITFQSGEKVIVKNLQFEVGGGGTNTAACFAKMGLATGYCGAVGIDTNGNTVLFRLEDDDVAFLGTTVRDHQTNYSVVLESALLKDRTILVYKGASEHLKYEDVKPFKTRWIYTSSLAGGSFMTSIKLIGEQRAKGVLVAANPSNYQIEQNIVDVQKLLSLTDIAVMNREEATALVGKGSLVQQMQRIRALGPVLVAITDGKRGSAVGCESGAFFAEPTPGLKVRETTGAGDCFASTFVGAIIQGHGLISALKWAMNNVEEHIQHVGAKAGFLNHDELAARVAKDRRAIKVL
jgi:ribokinase